MDTLEKLLATTKTGFRVIVLRDLVIDEEVEAAIKRLENRGIRVMREEKELTISHAIERMEEILAGDEKLAAEVSRRE